MSEIRKDYITDTWVVVSTERGQRPLKKGQTECEEAGETDPACVFCPGNEHKTPPEIVAYRGNGSKPNSPGWWLRVFANKFPALRIEGDVNPRNEDVFDSMNGIGAHEVLVEMPEHNKCLATKSVHDVEEVIHGYKERYTDLTNDKRFKYIIIFKNHGSVAGASQPHPHSQIIAIPMVPRRMNDELWATNGYFQRTGRYIFDHILESELAAKERIVYENDHFVVLSPYAARFPYEMWAIPKHHDPIFEDITDKERRSLADAMKKVLGALYELLDDPPYNYYIHTAPADGRDYSHYHWHIEITPRLTETAGFERGTGFYINPMPPELATRQLRELID